MKKIYLIIVPFWFALFSYLLLEQLYLALFCFALCMMDVLFFIFKKKKEQEKEKKKYLMDEAFLDTLLISPNEINKTLESFNLDCDYAEVDKDASYQSFKDRREGYYLRALEEAKKKKKEKMFLSKMRILGWKIKKKRLPRMYLLAQIRSSQFVKTLQVVYPRMVEISRVLRNCREKCSCDQTRPISRPFP